MTPVFQLALRFVKVPPPVYIEILVAQAAIERLDEAVLHGSSRPDEVQLDLPLEDPGVEVATREFRAVVGCGDLRLPSTSDQLVEFTVLPLPASERRASGRPEGVPGAESRTYRSSLRERFSEVLRRHYPDLKRNSSRSLLALIYEADRLPGALEASLRERKPHDRPTWATFRLARASMFDDGFDEEAATRDLTPVAREFVLQSRRERREAVAAKKQERVAE